jgi:SP family general alpha glucoside:H+ symporter-like MFS transporter
LPVGGKCGFVWGGTALFTLIVAYFCLPEMKNRSYREIDILFQRRTSARKFKTTHVGIEEDE